MSLVLTSAVCAGAVLVVLTATALLLFWKQRRRYMERRMQRCLRAYTQN